MTGSAPADSIGTLWIEAVDHLRGREIYPADRQSFIFNPIEILGVAVGLMTCRAAGADQKDWLAQTIVRGIHAGQFRTPLSVLAANTTLALLDPAKASAVTRAPLNVSILAIPELVLAAGIDLGFERYAALDRARLQEALMRRLLVEPVGVNDAVEAATLMVVSRRMVERLVLLRSETTALERLLTICRRFPLFVERLQNRQRGRPPFEVKDEYDVQDLLHAILKLHFDDVRPEEYTPSYGGKASKVDFLLPDERTVVEAKMTRANLGQKEVTDELIIDAARYSQMDGVETLICLVYDPLRRCGNPRTVENDVQNSGSRLNVRAIVCPQGL